jgi:hypothetical protein
MKVTNTTSPPQNMPRNFFEELRNSDLFFHSYHFIVVIRREILSPVTHGSMKIEEKFEAEKNLIGLPH